jgi:hypothetical protein
MNPIKGTNRRGLQAWGRGGEEAKGKKRERKGEERKIIIKRVTKTVRKASKKSVGEWSD